MRATAATVRFVSLLTILATLLLLAPQPALGLDAVRVTFDEALRAARLAAPELVVARAREAVARAEVGVAGAYPNPSVSGGSSTQAAKISGTLSLPLIVLGQRGAATAAARAEEATVLAEAEVAWNDVRQATEHAYTALWLAEEVAAARRESAGIEAALEASVVQRVEVGSAPEIDATRVRAERLRADADAVEAEAEVSAAGSELGRWMGKRDGGSLRTSGPPAVPDDAPSLGALLARVPAASPVRREQSDARAAEARADRERALVRPALTLDVGFDALDPTLFNVTNYRAQLAIEVPLFNQRGALVERERALGRVATARAEAAVTLATAELAAAYRVFDAATTRRRMLAEAVLPAARAAAEATEAAYRLGRAPLVAVLDAERALVDARLSVPQARAARAMAWADVEHALGEP